MKRRALFAMAIAGFVLAISGAFASGFPFVWLGGCALMAAGFVGLHFTASPSDDEETS